jgi:hypothetical protein
MGAGIGIITYWAAPSPCKTPTSLFQLQNRTVPDAEGCYFPIIDTPIS